MRIHLNCFKIDFTQYLLSTTSLIGVVIESSFLTILHGSNFLYNAFMMSCWASILLPFNLIMKILLTNSAWATLLAAFISSGLQHLVVYTSFVLPQLLFALCFLVGFYTGSTMNGNLLSLFDSLGLHPRISQLPPVPFSPGWILQLYEVISCMLYIVYMYYTWILPFDPDHPDLSMVSWLI